MSLFGGIDKFGLADLKNIESDKSLIESNAEKAGIKNDIKKEEKVETEKDFVYGKVFECPVCDSKFKQPVVKSAKARMLSTDKDLKPNYKIIDPLKYEVIHCNKCGYAVLSRYYGPLAKPHKEMLKKTIASRFKPQQEAGELISYEQAFARFQLTLANAMCRQAKTSELGLIYLKFAWLVREMIGHMDELPKDNEEFSENNLKAMEDEALKNAKENFENARTNENPPIAGMNDVTLDYLLAVLYMRYNQYEPASKLISEILMSSSANTAQKERARDLKEELKAILLSKK